MASKIKCTAFVNSFYSSVSYILTLDNSDIAWVVDPGDIGPIQQFISDNGLRVTGIILTHCHYDHIYGINALMSYHQDCHIYTNSYGASMLDNPKLNLSKYHETPYRVLRMDAVRTVEDGAELTLDSDVRIKAVFTPGHNQSCVSWATGNMLFTGDSYIPGLKTVTNLPGANKEQAKESESKIKELAENRIIYPGHPALQDQTK